MNTWIDTIAKSVLYIRLEAISPDRICDVVWHKLSSLVFVCSRSAMEAKRALLTGTREEGTSTNFMRGSSREAF
jgi:hypothetical protein